ncbi:MAG: hypothetical protein GXO90_11070 [FCB group bacterium]|nr:hypothetical protein [FCB group bacterium]
MINNLFLLFWGLVFLFIPFDRGPETPLYNTILLCSASGLLGIYYYLCNKNKEYTIRNNILIIIFAAFIFWILLSNIWTIDAFATDYKSLTYLAAFILFFATVNYPDRLDESFIVKFILVLFGIEMLIGIWQFFTEINANTIQGSFFARSHGFFVWPNTFAGYIILIWPMIFWKYLYSPKRKYERILFLLLFIGEWVLGTTYSRAGWLAFFLTSVVLNLYILHRYQLIQTFALKLKRVALSMILVIVGLSAIPGSQIISRMGSLTDPDTFGRQRIWAQTFHLAKDHPWIGYGFRTFHITNTQWLPPGIRFDFAHNDYLQYFEELGIIGLGLFLIFLIFLAGKGFSWFRLHKQLDKISAPVTGMGVGALAVLIHTFVDYHLYIPGILTLFLLFIAIFLRHHPNASIQQIPITGKVIAVPTQRLFQIIVLITLVVFSVIQPLAQYFTQQGDRAVDAEDYYSALKNYQIATVLESRRGENYMHLGSVYSNQAIREKDHLKKWILLNSAEKEFERSTELGPLTWNYWQVRGEFYKRHLLQLVSSGFSLDKLTVLDTTMPGWRDMWLTVPKMNRFFNRALELYPNNPDLWINRAETWLQFEEPESSLVWFKKFIKWDPRDLSAKVAFGDALQQLGQYKQSLGNLKSVIKTDSTYGYAWYLMGRNYYYLGNQDSAFLSLQLAKRINPEITSIDSWIDSVNYSDDE